MDLVWSRASKGIGLCNMVSCWDAMKRAMWQVEGLEREIQSLLELGSSVKTTGCEANGVCGGVFS